MKNQALVVKVKKDSNGGITHVMLDDGSVHSMDEALSMSRAGLIENIIVRQGETRTEYYRDNPTSLGDDSFNHIPEF